MNELTLQIDGREVKGNKGDTIMQVCEGNNIYVPTLCHFWELSNPGTCRMCSVEVQGGRGYSTACTTPAQEGMVVRTESEALTELRRNILQLLFSERNHFCMFCEMSGDCELQALAYRYKIDHFKYPFLYPKLEVDSSNRYFVIDHNRCILCTRCVRACSQMVANDTLGPMNRGNATVITADLDEPVGQSSCVSCGTCVQICPTGALIDRRSAYGGKTAHTSTTASVCPGCSLGCPVNVVTRAERVLRIEGDLESEVNHGLLCEQGRYAPLYDVPQRHLTPLIKHAGRLEQATWTEALDLVAKELRSRIGNSRTLAGVASPRATNEAIYLFQKMFRTTLRSNHLSTLGEGSPQNGGFTASYLGATLPDVDAADHVLVIGADLTKSHQVLGFAVKRAVRRGATLTVIGAGGNGLAQLATSNIVPLRPDYGTIVNGLMQAIVAAGLAKRTVDGEASFTANLEKYSIHAVAKRTVVPEAQLEEAAKAYGRASAPVIIWSGGDDGLEMAVLSLAAITGNYDGRKARVLRLGQGLNSRGALEMGGTGAYLPGRLTWSSPVVQRFEQAWAAPLRSNSGNGSRPDAVFFLLSDSTTPPDEATLRLAKGARFVVVQAAYHSALDEVANVVLPSPAWAEKEGTITSADGSVQRLVAVVRPPVEVRDDWAVLTALLAKLGARDDYRTADEVFKEIAHLVPSYGGRHDLPAGAFTPACVDF